MVSIAAFQAVDPGSIPGRRIFLAAGLRMDAPIRTRCLLPTSDEVAEWLRRWTANPMGSARVGSNPILVDSFVACRTVQWHRSPPTDRGGDHGHWPPTGDELMGQLVI